MVRRNVGICGWGEDKGGRRTSWLNMKRVGIDKVRVSVVKANRVGYVGQ